MAPTPATGGSGAAGGEIVAFCDDDVLVDRNWIASLALAFARGERVGGAAGLTLPRELETPAQVWFEGFASANRGLETRVLDRRNPPPDRPLFPFTIGDLGSGENFAFRRELLIALGGFDPDLGSATPTHGGEDVEAMLRVLLADRQVVYEPRAIVRHAHLREFEQFERRVWGYGVGLSACLTKALLAAPGPAAAAAPQAARGASPTRSRRGRRRTWTSRRTTPPGSPGSSCAAWPTARSPMREAAPGAGAVPAPDARRPWRPGRQSRCGR